jgi:hypothetical protein
MSTSKDKRGDVFDRIEAEDADDDARRILAMSDAELDHELAAGGLDPVAVRAKGRALGESLMRAPKRARLVKGAKIGGLVAAGVAIALGAAWLLRPPPTFPISPEPPPPSAVPKVDPAPRELRLEATIACDARKWDTCVQLLDQAAALDPAGDRSAEVQATRARASKGQDEEDGKLQAKPKP